MQKMIFIGILVALWLFAIVLFKKTKMNFFGFLVGSIGMFTIGTILSLPFLEGYLEKIIANLLNIIAMQTHLFEVYKTDSIISVQSKTGIISILIDYECSGIIEMLVFSSLLIFFPFGSRKRKILMILIGNLSIFFANIIRILFIVILIKTFGVGIFYVAHTLLGRILFFALMIILYYFVFSSTHLKYQRVGDI